MSYDEVVKDLEDVVEKTHARATKAENWLKVHQWVFVPAAFVVGILLGVWF